MSLTRPGKLNFLYPDSEILNTKTIVSIYSVVAWEIFGAFLLYLILYNRV